MFREVQVILQKSGSGGVYISAVTYSTQIIQSGKGVTAISSTDSVRPWIWPLQHVPSIK